MSKIRRSKIEMTIELEEVILSYVLQAKYSMVNVVGILIKFKEFIVVVWSNNIRVWHIAVISRTGVLKNLEDHTLRAYSLEC